MKMVYFLWDFMANKGNFKGKFLVWVRNFGCRSVFPFSIVNRPWSRRSRRSRMISLQLLTGIWHQWILSPFQTLPTTIFLFFFLWTVLIIICFTYFKYINRSAYKIETASIASIDRESTIDRYSQTIGLRTTDRTGFRAYNRWYIIMA